MGRDWVGVRKVMEEISKHKDQVIKGLICSVQELGIFPEGTVCVRVCMCARACARAIAYTL